jgi:ribosomal protein S18 acetylase RimI-like enzyme
MHELPFLEEMSYQAIFVPPGKEKYPRDIIWLPELQKYFVNFGKPHDYCLVAEKEGNLVGAIWIRLLSGDKKGYGFVDDQTPELSIAVDEKHRNEGIGTYLLERMLSDLESRKQYKQVSSLSVDLENYAFEFYKRKGFTVAKVIEVSATMVRLLR